MDQLLEMGYDEVTARTYYNAASGDVPLAVHLITQASERREGRRGAPVVTMQSPIGSQPSKGEGHTNSQFAADVFSNVNNADPSDLDDPANLDDEEDEAQLLEILRALPEAEFTAAQRVFNGQAPLSPSQQEEVGSCEIAGPAACAAYIVDAVARCFADDAGTVECFRALVVKCEAAFVDVMMNGFPHRELMEEEREWDPAMMLLGKGSCESK